LIDLVVRQSEEEEKAIGKAFLRRIRSSVLALFQQILGVPSIKKCNGILAAWVRHSLLRWHARPIGP